MSKLTDQDLESRYDDMLDEAYPDLTIAGLSYSTSNALKEIDPTAYRCGFNDWLDSEVGETVFEVGGEYFDSEVPNLSPEKSHMLRDLKGIVSELQDTMRSDPAEYTEHGTDEPSIDIRLCVDNDSSWIFRTGLSDYDPSHSDYCAASSVQLDTDPEKLLASLLDDINDQINEGN